MSELDALAQRNVSMVMSGDVTNIGTFITREYVRGEWAGLSKLQDLITEALDDLKQTTKQKEEENGL